MKAREPCAMCERFTTAGYDQQAAAGMGRCTGFDNEGTLERFVPADAAPCVLFKRAKDAAPRARFLERARDTSKQKSEMETA